MISFMALGNHGRLGNQMFQVAATLSAADRLKTKAHFPRGAQIEQVFELKDCLFTDTIQPEFAFFENSFEFNPIFSSIPDSCNVHGYFQTERYFKDCENVIFENFKFKESIRDKTFSIMNQINSAKCAVHVRRGDYVNLSDVHQFPGIDYYRRSMEIIREKSKSAKFLIFSDDIDWCKRLDAFVGCQFVTEESDAIEMCMMSMCDFHIIANSSFSWWGSRLSNSSHTIAPSRWFGPSGPKNWQDVYCKNWETV